MDVKNAFPTTAPRGSEPAARPSGTGNATFERVMSQARNSAAAPNAVKTGAPAPKPRPDRPAIDTPARTDARPPRREALAQPASSTESKPAARGPASDQPASVDGEVRHCADEAAQTEDTLAAAVADDSTLGLAALPAPEPTPLTPLPAATSPAAQQIALIAQALGLQAEAASASAAPPAANATAATAHTAAMAVAPTAIDATATATLATELAALAQTASGDEAIADGRPATPAAPTSVSTATAAAAPMPPGANPAPSAAPALPALPAAPLPSSPGQPAFAGEFGNRVMLMAHGQVKSAQIALNPGELGPVEVRLELRGQEASLVMSAAHPATRAALEDALPRLREMFAAQGLELADAQVGADSRGESNPSGEGRPRRGGSEAAANAVASPPAASLQAHGLIDTFA